MDHDEIRPEGEEPLTTTAEICQNESLKESLDRNEMRPDSLGESDIGLEQSSSTGGPDELKVPLRAFATPGRRRFSMARDPIMGTPVVASTPHGALSTPFSFSSPLMRDSLPNSPSLHSPMPSKRIKSPSKSPAQIMSTPIKVFTPATGRTPGSIKSILGSSSKSVMDDARQFSQLSPSTSKVVSGGSASPVKHSPAPSPYNDQVQSSPLGLYGMTMPSPLKRSFDELSQDDYEVPTILVPSQESRHDFWADREEASSPIVKAMGDYASHAHSSAKQQSNHDQNPETRRANERASPVKRTRRPAFFDDDEPSRLGIHGLGASSSPTKRSPRPPPPEIGSALKQSGKASRSKPSGFDSNFDDDFSMSPVKASHRGAALSGFGVDSPNVKQSDADVARPVGFDSLFDDTFSLSPVQISPQKKPVDNTDLSTSVTQPRPHILLPTKQRSPKKTERPLGFGAMLEDTYSQSPVRIAPKKQMPEALDHGSTTPGKESSAKQLSQPSLVGFDSLFEDTYSLSPAQAALPEQMLEDEVQDEDEDDEDEQFTEEVQSQNLPSPMVAPSAKVTDTGSSPAVEHTGREMPAGFDSLFDNSYTLYPVKGSLKRKMLDESDEENSEAEDRNYTTSSPVKHSPTPALLRRESSGVGKDLPLPSSPATTLPARVLDSAPHSSPTKRSPQPSFMRRSSSFSPDKAEFESSFGDSIFTMSPVRLSQQTAISSMNRSEEASSIAPEPQLSPVKLSPRKSPERMHGLNLITGPTTGSNPGLPGKEEISRLDSDSMDFSLIRPPPGFLSDGKSPIFSQGSPLRRSSVIFAEDGSPRISMSAKSSPISGAFFAEDGPSRLGMEIQPSPTKQSAAKDNASSAASRVNIPSSPPTSPSRYSNMLPDDINDCK